LKRVAIYIALFFLTHLICGINSLAYGQDTAAYLSLRNIVSDPQLLINGRIWRNLYSKAVGHPYFLSPDFLPGTLSFNGRKFESLPLKYDILNDELLLGLPFWPVIILNKELVDSFTLTYNDRTYHIINAGSDSANVIRGYINVLYDGHSALYVKNIKELLPMAVDRKYDLIAEKHKIYFRKDSTVFQIQGKKGLLKLLEDKNTEIKEFVRKNNIKMERRDPSTFIPVIKFYDSMRH